MGTEQATGVKVFSTTLARDREVLGESITRWLAAHPELEIVDKQVRQSSDSQFHCLSITLFYRERSGV
jgi:folate-dependent tRNA-U54 methylase TrmFO/GidA